MSSSSSTAPEPSGSPSSRERITSITGSSRRSATWWGRLLNCAEAYGVKEAVEGAGIELLEDFKGHPSVRTLVSDGYEVVSF
jgi:hypothetical protein